jgi:hypothetical protein
MSEETQGPDPTGEKIHAKDMLIKYVPERNYKDRKYKPYKKGFPDLCGHCKSYYKNIHEIGLTTNAFPVECKGHILDPIKELRVDDFDNEEEYQEVITMIDPVSWAYKMFPDDKGVGWAARWYQEELATCTADRKIVRAGRRTGKSELICMIMMWMTHVNSNFTILVIVPYEAQVNLLWDKIMAFVSRSPEIESSIRRSTKSPEHRLEFNNGSKIIGFSSGPSSAARSDKIRGQDANYIVLDEADYLASDDIEAILAILASHKNCGMWASSTPTGKHDKFYQFATSKDAGFKEFHFISAESPSWTENAEMFFKTTFDAVTYEHEFLAEFGIQEQGVFRNDLVDASLINYSLPRERSGPGSRIIIGVDWNGQAVGAHITVVEVVHSSHGLKYVLLDKIIVRGVEFTQHASVNKIIELDKQYNADFVYIDHGFGEMQFEMLQMHGKQTPGSTLHKRVRSYMFGGQIEIKDPLSNKMIKKHAKPFLVNATTLALERGTLVLPTSEDTQILVNSTEDEDEGQTKGIVQQMRNFAIERYSSSGQPTYSQGEDHSLIAYMLSITGFLLEFSDMKKDMTMKEQMLFINKIDSEGKPVEKSKVSEELSALVRQLGAGAPISQMNKNVASTISSIKSNNEFAKRKIAGGNRAALGEYLSGKNRGTMGKNSRRNF